MGRKNKKTKRRRKIEPDNAVCPFCTSDDEFPTYKEYKKLSTYITDRARIVGSERSGICSKHQRQLTIQLKRARHLGLLPYAPQV